MGQAAMQHSMSNLDSTPADILFSEAGYKTPDLAGVQVLEYDLPEIRH